MSWTASCTERTAPAAPPKQNKPFYRREAASFSPGLFMWAGPISSCLPGGGQFAVAYRRRGAFCKGIVSTARRGGLPFAPAKGSKTGQRGTGLSPLQTSLTLSCAGYGFRFSRSKNLNPHCAQMRSKGSLRQHLPHPPCGARKNHRAARLLDFFDRYGCSASLHPPPAALGSAPPIPPPMRGRGRLGK